MHYVLLRVLSNRSIGVSVIFPKYVGCDCFPLREYWLFSVRWTFYVFHYVGIDCFLLHKFWMFSITWALIVYFYYLFIIYLLFIIAWILNVLIRRVLIVFHYPKIDYFQLNAKVLNVFHYVSIDCFLLRKYWLFSFREHWLFFIR